MGRISQAYRRSDGSLAATGSETGAAADSIFNAYAPERHSEAEAASPAPRPAANPTEPMRARTLTAVPFPSVPTGAQAPAQTPPRNVTRPPAAADAPPSGARPLVTETDADRLIDPKQVGDYLGFIAGSVRRHWLLAGLTAVVIMATTTALTLVWPKQYFSDATLLVQRNDVMASLVNPGRTIAREAESPTRAAEAIVLQHENLRSIIKETDAMTAWERTRAPLLQTKDRIFERIRGPQTEEQRLDSMVGLLESRMKIWATPEGEVTFQLTWPDPEMAHRMVDQAIQNFLQYRRVNETSAITDSIAILDQSVQDLETQVTKTIAELPKRPVPTVRRAAPAPAPAAAAAAVVTPTGPPPDVIRRLAKLKSDLDDRRQSIARLEEQHRQQLSEAQTRLASAKMVYAEDFPTVIALRQSVAQLSRESPELTALRREAQTIETDLDAMTTALQSADQSGMAASVAQVLAGQAAAARPDASPIEFDFSSIAAAGEANDPTSLRLKVELAELATVRERANAARAELSSSQAGFKYQYTVIRPPQVPRGPSSPKIPVVLGAGLMASLLLALMAAVTTDLVGGRILDSWQVERQLGVPVALTLRER